MSGKGGLKSTKHGKSMRNKKRVNYKQMHSGKATEYESSSHDDSQFDMDFPPSKTPMMGNTGSAAPPGASPIVPLEWLHNSHDEKDYDDHIADISAEMARIDKEEKQFKKQETLEATKLELASKRQNVSDLKGTISGVNKTSNDFVKTSKKNKKSSSSKTDKDVIIHTLRNDEHLQTFVCKELKRMGLASANQNVTSSDTDSDTSSSRSSDSDSYSSDKGHSKSKKQKKKNRSGINAKSSDKVKFPQGWPHAHLQYEHDKHVKFQDLNFKL